MALLKRFYKAEEQHVRKTMAVYNSFQQTLSTIQDDFQKDMEKAKAVKPKKDYS